MVSGGGTWTGRGVAKGEEDPGFSDPSALTAPASVPSEPARARVGPDGSQGLFLVHL